jgi:hypothetical protein
MRRGKGAARMKEQFQSIVQIADALAGNCLATEIVATIAKERPIVGVADLVELLFRAKEVRAEAEGLPPKVDILMAVLKEILKAFPDLAQP